MCKSVIVYRVIQDEDLEAFLELMREYLPDSEEQQVLYMRKKYWNAYVGCYENQCLIGIAYGWERQEDATFMLAGITIQWEKKAQGLGSGLLDFWEEQVRAMGYTKASVGSAPGYPEHFYIKNGYVPVAYKAIDNQGLSHVRWLRSLEDYQNLNRKTIDEEAGGNEGFVVLEHTL